MSEDAEVVVMDTGSSVTKAGFAGESFPRMTFPTAVARFRRQGLFDGFPLITCGREAIKNRGVSNLTWPVQDGLIQDWDEMEKLWFHIFYKELHVPPETCRVLHSVHPLVSKKDKERMAEILFESFAIEGMYLMKSPVLVLHASGKTTGLIWENGASCSYVTPVFEGFPLEHSTKLCPITGDKMTQHLQKSFCDIGYSFTTPAEMDIINDIKAQCCYIAQDFDLEERSLSCSGENKLKYTLPDGQNILIGEERFRCPEILFNPQLGNLDCPSIIDTISSSITTCEIDYQPIFYQNIVLGGGTTMFRGLLDRLQKELSLKLVNSPMTAHVEALDDRQYAAWTGGSILASLSIMKGFWMTSEEYQDAGADRVNYKFF